MNINKFIIFTLIISFSAIISDSKCSDYSIYDSNNKVANKYSRNKKVVKNESYSNNSSLTNNSNKSINSDNNYLVLQGYDDDYIEKNSDDNYRSLQYHDDNNDIEENCDAPISYGEYYHKYHEISNEMAAPSPENYNNNHHGELSVSAFSAAPLPKRSNHAVKTTQVLNYEAEPSIR